MQVLVVPRNHLDHRTRPGQPGVGSHEDPDGTRTSEAVDQVLGQAAVDLAHRAGRSLPAIPSRVVDVHVEPVLVRGVSDDAEPRPEVAALWTTQIAHAHPGSPRMLSGVPAHDPEHGAHETVGAVAPPPAVRRSSAYRVPREEVPPLARQAHASDQAPRTGETDGS